MGKKKRKNMEKLGRILIKLAKSEVKLKVYLMKFELFGRIIGQK